MTAQAANDLPPCQLVIHALRTFGPGDHALERQRCPILSCLGPAFRERQSTGAEGPPFALPRPWPTRCLDAVARQPGTKRRYQHGANTVWTSGVAIWLRMDQQGLADVIPGEGDLFVPGRHLFGPEITWIA